MKGRPADSILGRGDARTLALSTVHLDGARLRQVLVFERTLRGQAPTGASAEQTAAAHAAAVVASGLSSSEVEAPLALLRRFAANRSLSATLSAHLLRMEVSGKPGEALEEQAGELRRRLLALDEALVAREDVETRHLLEAHATEILALFAGSQSNE